MPPTTYLSHLSYRTKSSVIFSVLFILGLLVPRFLTSGTVDVVIDAAISKPGTLELFPNVDAITPLQLNVTGPERKQYKFRYVTAALHSLRIDPAVQMDTKVSICEIQIQSQGKIVLPIKSRELLKWAVSNAQLKYDEVTGCLSVIPTSDDPYLFASINFSQPSPLFRIIPTQLDRDNFLWILSVIFLVFLFLIGILKRWLLCIVTTATVSLMLLSARYTVDTVLELGGEPPPVAESIGHASYYGIEKSAETNAFWAAVLVALLAFILVYFIESLRRRLTGSPFNLPPVQSSSRFSLAFIAVLILGYSVFQLPDFGSLLSFFSTTIHDTGYDFQNVITWQYALYRGLIPFRDLWYPYGGLFYLSYPLQYPDGKVTLLIFSHLVLLVGSLMFLSYWCLNYSKSWTIGILVVLTFMQELGIIGGIERYLMPAVIILGLAAALYGGRTKGWALLGFFVGYVFFLDIVQLAYALPGCLLLLFVRIQGIPSWGEKRQLLKHLIVSAVCALSIAGAYIFYLSINDALEGYIAFYSSLDATGYALIRADIADWIDFPNSREQWLLIMLLILTSTSTLFAISRIRACDPRDFVPLALTMVIIMLMQKQLVRPHMAYQIISICMLAGAILIYRAGALLNPQPKLAVAWLGLSSGYMLQLILSGFINLADRSPFLYFRYLFTEFPEQLADAAGDQPSWRAAKGRYFSPDTFIVNGKSGEFFKIKLSEQLHLNPGEPVYVFGDEAYVYPALQQDPSYQLSFYAQSVSFFQLDTVQRLISKPPKYILWNSARNEFDGVPNIVRVPILFNYFIDNFSYFGECEGFSIFKPRPAGAPLDLFFWKERLGETLNLGYIPSRSTLDSFPKTDETVGRPVLEVRIKQPQSGRKQTIYFDIDGQTFGLQFIERKNTRKYHINLENVWFYKLARENNIPSRMMPLNEPNVRATITHRIIDANILY